MTTTTQKFFKTWARMGYVARGIVYLDIGALAMLAAVGQGGETTNSKGAILNIKQQPFGEALLIILIIGLLGYILWRSIQAIKDTDMHGVSAKGLTVRTALMVSAIVHALLAVWAIRLLLGNGDSGSSESEQLLSGGAGVFALGVGSIIIIGVGIAHVFKGWTARFERYMTIPSEKNIWARPICRVGLIARGIVWLVLGGILMRSTFKLGSSDTKTMVDAFSWLNSSPYGSWLLGIVAAGLFAFGIYSLLEAMYRKINMT